MTVPAHMLRASLNDALEVIAAADTARSLGEGALASVLKLPEPQRAQLLELLRQCWELNEEIMAAGQRLGGTLDELARIAQHATTAAGSSRVKDLAAELRPHLEVIADASHYGSEEYVDAVYAVNRIIESTPHDRLAGGSMRSALSPGRHALLMGFVRGVAEPQLAQHPGAGSGEATGAIPPATGGLTTPLKEVAA